MPEFSTDQLGTRSEKGLYRLKAELGDAITGAEKRLRVLQEKYQEVQDELVRRVGVDIEKSNRRLGR